MDRNLERILLLSTGLIAGMAATLLVTSTAPEPAVVAVAPPAAPERVEVRREPAPTRQPTKAKTNKAPKTTKAQKAARKAETGPFAQEAYSVINEMGEELGWDDDTTKGVLRAMSEMQQRTRTLRGKLRRKKIRFTEFSEQTRSVRQATREQMVELVGEDGVDEIMDSLAPVLDELAQAREAHRQERDDEPQE